MTVDFEELSYPETPFGELVLRRRTEVSLGVEVYEVKASEACVVKFPNPLLGREAACTVYLGMSSAPSTMSGRI
jgi:hypothetical protein